MQAFKTAAEKRAVLEYLFIKVGKMYFLSIFKYVLGRNEVESDEAEPSKTLVTARGQQVYVIDDIRKLYTICISDVLGQGQKDVDI